MTDIRKLFESFSNLKVGVIGDIMLDTYWWGRVDRISPEAPVPIVALHHKEYRIGGAANVALNCRSLGANVTILSVTGDDDDAESLNKLLQKEKIDSSFLIKSKDRITTNKIRVIGRNQQMMRLDAENSDDLNPKDEADFIARVNSYIEKEKPSILIFEDYNKGVLTKAVITSVMSICKQHNILTATDPKRKNFFTYHSTDIFKPNLKEVKDALNISVENINKDELSDVHVQLKNKLDHKISFITLSEHGVFYNHLDEGNIIPSHFRNIADVSGAGDTVIAVAAMVYSLTEDEKLMAEIANIAGGLVCEEVGTVAINKEKLLKECELLLG